MTTLQAQYSPQEELANAISHGIGALASVAALTLLVTFAVLENNYFRVVSFAIYGVSLVLMFLSSTLYHAIYHIKTKRIFKTLDHCAIYILIAGTYTPLLLLTLQGNFGYLMCAVIWGIALAGVIFKIKFGNNYKIISVASYLGMGLLSLLMINALLAKLAVNGVILLAVGGAIYCSGVFFYLQKRIPFNHAIWHLFVLGGASCHFFLMWFYV